MSNFYPATALTGGGAGALDAVDGAGLADGDVAFVGLLGHATYGNALLVYMLDADSAASESSPDVIAPDDNAGDKRWVLAMSGINSGLHLATALPVLYGSGTGITATVGNAYIAEISKTGASVDVESVADIASPSAWTDLIDLSGKYQIFWKHHSTVGLSLVQIVVANTEDTGNAIRLQVLRDGDVVWDQTVTRAEGGAITQQLYYTVIANSAQTLFCEESFTVRAARKGTMASASSLIKIGAMAYETLE